MTPPRPAPPGEVAAPPPPRTSAGGTGHPRRGGPAGGAAPDALRPAVAGAGGTRTGRDATRRTGLRRSARAATVAGGVLLALYLLTIALRLLSTAAGGTADVLERFSVEGALNLVGFGWLMAYVTLAGSPVAALSLSLLDGGAIEPREALAMLAGSRFGAALIVLVVGFIAYVRGQRAPDGIYIGVIALLTTWAIYTPATALALVLVDAGWFADAGTVVPAGWGDVVERLTDPVIDPLADALPGAALFVGGVGLLLGAFWVFDRLLPNLDPPTPRVERLSRRLSSVRAMFLLGLLVTAVTMSVAISVTILVPLTLKGIVRRQTVIPYIMGANISTFVDTLFAALLLPADAAPGVVLAQVVGVTVVSLAVLLFAYERFARVVLGLAERVARSRTGLATFLAVSALAPLVLLAL